MLGTCIRVTNNIQKSYHCFTTNFTYCEVFLGESYIVSLSLRYFATSSFDFIFFPVVTTADGISGELVMDTASSCWLLYVTCITIKLR